jgi:hypothetical protein
MKGTFSAVRNLQDTLYPSRHPCRLESSAIRMRCRTDAKLPELTFRALLTEGASEVKLALGSSTSALVPCLRDRVQAEYFEVRSSLDFVTLPVTLRRR